MCHPERSKAKSKDLDYFIFIPAYNVSLTLADVLGRIPSAVMERAEVLVIDDGSKDDTRGAYETFVGASRNLNTASPNTKYAAHLEYMRFEFNRGYGAVVKCGISEGLRSGAKYIACLHGDGQYPAEQLGEFFAHLETAGNSPAGNPPENTAPENAAPEFDPRGQPEVSAPAGNRPASAAGNSPAIALVQGSRRLVSGAARAGNMPLHKRIGGAFLTALENIAFRQKLTDRHSGFIVYNAEFLKTLDLVKLSPSFDIDLEIISIADARGWRLAELPIPTRYAGEKSNLNVVTYGLRVLRQTWRRFCMR